MDEFLMNVGFSLVLFISFGFALELCELMYQLLVRIRRRRMACWNKTISRTRIRELTTQQD
jgi:hypothetical protein